MGKEIPIASTHEIDKNFPGRGGFRRFWSPPKMIDASLEYQWLLFSHGESINYSLIQMVFHMGVMESYIHTNSMDVSRVNAEAQN